MVCIFTFTTIAWAAPASNHLATIRQAEQGGDPFNPETQELSELTETPVTTSAVAAGRATGGIVKTVAIGAALLGAALGLYAVNPMLISIIPTVMNLRKVIASLPMLFAFAPWVSAGQEAEPKPDDKDEDKDPIKALKTDGGQDVMVEAETDSGYVRIKYASVDDLREGDSENPLENIASLSKDEGGYEDARMAEFLQKLNNIEDPLNIPAGSKVMVPEVPPDKLDDVLKALTTTSQDPDKNPAADAIAELHSEAIWDFYADVKQGKDDRGTAFVELKGEAIELPEPIAAPPAIESDTEAGPSGVDFSWFTEHSPAIAIVAGATLFAATVYWQRYRIKAFFENVRMQMEKQKFAREAKRLDVKADGIKAEIKRVRGIKETLEKAEKLDLKILRRRLKFTVTKLADAIVGVAQRNVILNIARINDGLDNESRRVRRIFARIHKRPYSEIMHAGKQLLGRPRTKDIPTAGGVPIFRKLLKPALNYILPLFGVLFAATAAFAQGPHVPTISISSASAPLWVGAAFYIVIGLVVFSLRPDTSKTTTLASDVRVALVLEEGRLYKVLDSQTGQIVGEVTLDYQEDKIEIILTVIDEDFRGCGYGTAVRRALRQEAVDLARDKGALWPLEISRVGTPSICRIVEKVFPDGWLQLRKRYPHDSPWIDYDSDEAQVLVGSKNIMEQPTVEMLKGQQEYKSMFDLRWSPIEAPAFAAGRGLASAASEPEKGVERNEDSYWERLRDDWRRRYQEERDKIGRTSGLTEKLAIIENIHLKMATEEIKKIKLMEAEEDEEKAPHSYVPFEARKLSWDEGLDMDEDPLWEEGDITGYYYHGTSLGIARVSAALGYLGGVAGAREILDIDEMNEPPDKIFVEAAEYYLQSWENLSLNDLIGSLTGYADRTIRPARAVLAYYTFRAAWEKEVLAGRFPRIDDFLQRAILRIPAQDSLKSSGEMVASELSISAPVLLENSHILLDEDIPLPKTHVTHPVSLSTYDPEDVAGILPSIDIYDPGADSKDLTETLVRPYKAPVDSALFEYEIGNAIMDKWRPIDYIKAPASGLVTANAASEPPLHTDVELATRGIESLCDFQRMVEREKGKGFLESHYGVIANLVRVFSGVCPENYICPDPEVVSLLEKYAAEDTNFAIIAWPGREGFSALNIEATKRVMRNTNDPEYFPEEALSDPVGWIKEALIDNYDTDSPLSNRRYGLLSGYPKNAVDKHEDWIWGARPFEDGLAIGNTLISYTGFDESDKRWVDRLDQVYLSALSQLLTRGSAERQTPTPPRTTSSS